MITNNLDVKKKIIMIIVAVSMIVGVVAVGIMQINSKDNPIVIAGDEEKQQELATQETISNEKKEPNKSSVFVHVTGAVAKPNLYKLADGARVYDAIMLAKPTKNADLDQVNLAEKIRDQMKIVVPKKGEVVSSNFPNSNNKISSNNSTGNGNSNSNKININTATESQIEELNGIGPSIAKRIIEYRQSNGGFRSIEDLKNVSGIGEKKFAKLKDQVRI